MHITWLGQACFKIQGQSSILVTDPYLPAIGFKMPRTTADIVTISSNEQAHAEAVKGQENKPPFIITSPGEYEIKDTLIYGINASANQEKNSKESPVTFYRIQMDNMTLVHLGNLDRPLENGQLEQLERIDILFIPVGGGKTLNGKQAAELISKIEPRIVIPMCYKIPGLKVSVAPLDNFCKEIGVCPRENQPKLKITKKDLPAEEMKVIVLEKV